MKGKLEPSESQKLIEEGKNLKEGLATLEEDLVKLTDELQMEAQCIPNMTLHMLRLEGKIVCSIEDSDQCLIGTAEIPVGGIHMDAILAESLQPLKYVAFSHCFRTEAGAADTATSKHKATEWQSLELTPSLAFIHVA
nr:serine--tRNA ligase, chloroplastic/mitochondrial-like [Populus alba]